MSADSGDTLPTSPDLCGIKEDRATATESSPKQCLLNPRHKFPAFHPEEHCLIEANQTVVRFLSDGSRVPSDGLIRELNDCGGIEGFRENSRDAVRKDQAVCFGLHGF